MNKDTKNFCKELKTLLEKYNVKLGVDIDGDTYGININGFVVVDGKGKQEFLADYTAYLSAYDLRGIK